MAKQKKVKKEKESKSKEFVCSYCELVFKGNPYAIVEFYNGLKQTICNEGCCKTFLKEEEEILSEEISNEVLMTPEFIAFMGILEDRADFKEILDKAKEEIDGARNTIEHCTAIRHKAVKNEM